MVGRLLFVDTDVAGVFRLNGYFVQHSKIRASIYLILMAYLMTANEMCRHNIWVTYVIIWIM